MVDVATERLETVRQVWRGCRIERSVVLDADLDDDLTPDAADSDRGAGCPAVVDSRAQGLHDGEVDGRLDLACVPRVEIDVRRDCHRQPTDVRSESEIG